MRYIIINDTFKAYEYHRNNMYERLQQLGWKGSAIAIIPKPSYYKRDEYLNNYIINQQTKKNEYLQNNQLINMINYKQTDEKTIFSVQPPYNHLFNNTKLDSEIEIARQGTLPFELKKLDHIICKKAERKLITFFYSHGI